MEQSGDTKQCRSSREVGNLRKDHPARSFLFVSYEWDTELSKKLQRNSRVGYDCEARRSRHLASHVVQRLLVIWGAASENAFSQSSIAVLAGAVCIVDVLRRTSSSVILAYKASHVHGVGNITLAVDTPRLSMFHKSVNQDSG